MLTVDIDYLKSILEYNYETGIVSNTVNRKCVIAGKEAGYTDKRTGYKTINIGNKIYPYHRVAWALYYSKWPDKCIDHIDGNPSNNRVDNLRDVSHRENMRNRKVPNNNKSGIQGVSLRKDTGNFEAYITSDTGRIHLGHFKNFFEACCARKSMENRLQYHKNHGNMSLRDEIQAMKGDEIER